MTGSTKTTSPTDSLAKTSAEATVELSEAALAEASGGVIAIAPANKFDSALKLDVNHGLLLPAVKPAG